MGRHVRIRKSVSHASISPHAQSQAVIEAWPRSNSRLSSRTTFNSHFAVIIEQEAPDPSCSMLRSRGGD